MIGDQPEPGQAREQTRLRLAAKRAARIGLDRVEILEKFYIDTQRVNPTPSAAIRKFAPLRWHVRSEFPNLKPH
jgi:hypothetical protein